MPVNAFDEGKNKVPVYNTDEVDPLFSGKQDKHIKTEVTLSTTWGQMSEVGGDTYPVQSFTIDGVTSQSTVIIRPYSKSTANVQAYNDAGIYFRQSNNAGQIYISRLGNAPESEVKVEVIVLNP